MPMTEDPVQRTANELLGLAPSVRPAEEAPPPLDVERALDGGTAPVARGVRQHCSLAAGQVDRVVLSALPDGMHLSRDARVACQKVATVSLFYLACLADDERTQKLKGRKRATLSSLDLRDAMGAAGFGHLVPLMRTLNKRSRE